MDRSDFEARAAGDGYTVQESAIAPDTHRPPHTHPFDARLFILDGALTLVTEQARHSFGPGEVCEVPAGTTHEEHTGAEGVRYVGARRTPASAAA